MTPATPILPPAGVVPVAPEMASAVDHGAELKRGMFFNTIALLASNFRGVFTFLIARLLGAAALGTFLVAWATTDVLSKIAMFGLDNTIIAFIARSEAAGEQSTQSGTVSSRRCTCPRAKHGRRRVLDFGRPFRGR